MAPRLLFLSRRFTAPPAHRDPRTHPLLPARRARTPAFPGFSPQGGPLNFLCLFSLALAVASCGDSGTNPPPPPPPPPVPVLSSFVSVVAPDSVEIGENFGYRFDLSSSATNGVAQNDSLRYEARDVSGAVVGGGLVVNPGSRVDGDLDMVSGGLTLDATLYSSASGAGGVVSSSSSAVKRVDGFVVELVDVRVGFEGFFYGGSHDDVVLEARVSGRDEVFFGESVGGEVLMRVPVGDSLFLRPRSREGSDFVHLVDGRSHEYHLVESGGLCRVTDAVFDEVVFSFGDGGFDGVVYSVPVSVPLLLAANKFGRFGFTGVSPSSMGSARTLDRRENHTVLFIAGPEVSGSPFEMRPADFFDPGGREHFLAAHEAVLRAYSHPGLPGACLPYGGEDSVRDFLRLEEVTPQYFLDNLWDGRVFQANENEPSIPGPVDFFHYTWVQSRARAGSSNSIVDGVLRTVSSNSATRSASPRNWFSEWQFIGPYDTRVDACDDKNRTNLEACFLRAADGRILGYRHHLLDPHTGIMSRDMVSSIVFNAVFAVASEDDSSRRLSNGDRVPFRYFPVGSTYWRELSDIDNAPDRVSPPMPRGVGQAYGAASLASSRAHLDGVDLRF